MLRLIIAAFDRLQLPMAHWLRSLSGGKFSTLIQRSRRLRDIGAGMARGTLTPSLPVRLQIETTDYCNLRCIHCTREVLDGMNTTSMGLEQFMSIVEQIDPYYVTMNGLGEPLIDKTIFKKLDFLHKRGARTSMPTNGTYIRRHKREELAANLPDILQLSIDGATKQSFEAVRKLADFGKTIDNYHAICAMKADGKTRPGTSIRVLCALQKANMREYREMYDLYKSLRGVDQFSLVPVFDYDVEGDAYVGLVPAHDEVVALHVDLDREILGATSEEEREFYRNWRGVSAQWLKTNKTNRVDPESNTAPCCIPWFSTYVDAKKRVYPCCYLTNTEHVMGQIGRGDDFRSIWHGERYRAFRDKLMHDRPHLEGCRTCPRNDRRVLKALDRLGPAITLGSHPGA